MRTWIINICNHTEWTKAGNRRSLWKYQLSSTLSMPGCAGYSCACLQKFSSPGLLEVSCFKICCQPGLSKMWGQMLKIGRMLVCRSPKLANILYGYWTHYVNIQGVSKKCNIAMFSLNLFQRSNYTFSWVFRNQNFEPVPSKHFEHTHSEYKMT